MNILVINAGSSSLKYQLIRMEDESILCKGVCERIGIDGKYSYKTMNGYKVEKEADLFTHKDAFDVIPVSYTHLDVYKRQHLCRVG